jgi:hypothetical protein
MKDYFTEILMVIGYSGRTQAAIILGMIGAIVIDLIGEYSLSNFHLSGPMSGLTDVIKESLAYRYDIAALAFLFSSWGTAFKLYHKDKNRF